MIVRSRDDVLLSIIADSRGRLSLQLKNANKFKKYNIPINPNLQFKKLTVLSAFCFTSFFYIYGKRGWQEYVKGEQYFFYHSWVPINHIALACKYIYAKIYCQKAKRKRKYSKTYAKR